MDDDFKILFVKPGDGGNQSTISEAFELLNSEDRGFCSQWITSEECLLIEATPKKNQKIFIFNEFDGECFEHIKTLGYRIYGPRCILSNLQNGLDLPRDKKRPIFNLAMRGVKLCCTTIDKPFRASILKMVHLMSGEVDSNLTEDVTHLVAGEVGSDKYMAAIANKKNVMTKEWVFDVWQSSQNKHVTATDEVFNKYKCPCFLGLTVVVSGFGTNERNQIMNFVVKGGGKYSGELKMNECTHLVVKEAKGAKYDAAKKWKIKIVRDKWLFECMDKGRYIDTKPYEFCRDGKNMKTSTPERLSVAGPNIMDVSNISCASSDQTVQAVNESEMTSAIDFDHPSFAFKTVAESRLGVTSIEMDATVAPADIFLDGCKVFLSGVKHSIQEKLKKIIISGSGFRATEISEEVTHVVMDDIVTADLLAVSKMVESPFVVSSDWLMDCFSRNTRIEETGYLRTDLDDGLTRKKPKIPPKGPDVGNAGSFIADNNRNTSKKPDYAHKVGGPGIDDDLPIGDLLSQYTMDDNDETLGKNNNDDDVKITDIEKGNETENNFDNTQDPNDYDDTSTLNDAGGIFYKKTFGFFGLDEDLEEDMKEWRLLIKAQGGCIVPQRRRIADIGIVPLTGYPVDAVVSEVLTVVWLQMCLENEVLVPYDHWLARPIEIPEEELLHGLCICVSGYAGIERNSIMFIAQTLGAMCQDSFAKSGNKKVMASTHLIVNAPGGSKYTAAKKWKVPAVGKEWLEACLKNKKKVSEEEYDIDLIIAKQEEKSAIASKNMDNKDESAQCYGAGKEIGESGTKEKGDKVVSVETANKKRTESINSDNCVEMEECQSNLPPEKMSDIVEPAVTKENIKTHDHLTADISQRSSDSSKKAICRPNQSDNIKAAHSKTPLYNTPMDRRRKMLDFQGNVDSPSNTSTPLGLIKGGGETPGTFLQPDFRAKFNIEGILSPDISQTTRDLNTSTPLGEVFRRHITKAAQHVADLNTDELAPSQSTELPPLIGVVIAVAKKLGRNHATLNSLVVELGGDYSWHYDKYVTHFVFQGRANDTNKEFRTARDDGKIIVSPHWLTACQEQGCRVDESLFPHHYNPASQATPKSVRATRNRGLHSATPSRAMPGKTPSRKMPVLDVQEVFTAKTDTPATSRKGSNSKESTTVSSGDNESVSPQKNNNKILDSCNQSSLHQQAKTPSPLAVTDHITPVANERVNPSDEMETAPKDGNKSLESKSQEMKDALTKTLGTVLEEASRSKKSRKKKGGLAKLSGQFATSDARTHESMVRTGTTSSMVWSAKGDANKNNDQLPEPSQSLQVTWDDPTERLEKEKLAHRLERVCDPSQNTDDYIAAIDLPSALEMPTSERSPTPEAPSLAFPVPRPATYVASPQPVEFLSDESSDSRLASDALKQTPIFLFSGMENQEKVEYGAIVEQVGGRVLEKQHFDPSCTHLVVAQPVRNEKYLSCIGAGKWVLHKSYLEACRKEGKLVKEENHEWGSQYTLSIMQNMTSQAFKLASAAHKWRRKVTALKKVNASCKGAFDGWKVMLCLGRSKEDSFKRLLEAGGADVVTSRPPFADNLKASHVFLDLNRVDVPQDDLVRLIEGGYHLVTAEYIAAHLTDDPAPDPSDFCPYPISALKTGMPDISTGRKRRAPSSSDSNKSRKVSRS